VSVFTTPGAWADACLEYDRDNKGLLDVSPTLLGDKAIPLPPEDSKELVQPAGCAAPTFTGAGFDIMEVVLTGVRLSVATLCSEDSNGYPGLDWDVGVLLCEI